MDQGEIDAQEKHDEIMQLRRENHQLKTENGQLKKKVAEITGVKTPEKGELPRGLTQRESLIAQFGLEEAQKHPSWPKVPTEPHE